MGNLVETHGSRARSNWSAHRAWTVHGKAGLRLPETVSSSDVQAHNRALEEQVAFLRAQRDELQRALGDAAQVQRKFHVPRRFRRGEFEIAGESFPAQQVSGDIVTVLDMGEHTLFAIGDICGKGLFAGMWFAHIAGLIRIFAQDTQDPAQIAAAINEHLAAMRPEPPMATLFLGRLQTASGELTYCNAGHPAPLLLGATGRDEWLSTGGPLLGAVAGAVFSAGQACLAPGEMLVGYSDGVVECRNRNGEDFDSGRLLAAARDAHGGSASGILFSILGATQDFAAAQPRADDIAILVVRRLPQMGSED